MGDLKKRVLIVVAAAGWVALARKVLAASGYDVAAVRNAGEAEDALEAAPPHLLLLEIRAPCAGALSLASRLKSKPATRSIVILALTDDPTNGDDLLAFDAGCDGAIFHPIDARALPKIIGEHLARATGPRRTSS